MPQNILRLYEQVDTLCGTLHTLHQEKLQCRAGCASCCVDDLEIFSVEARNIIEKYTQVLKEEEPHPLGACAMLNDQGHCRIYDARPYVCRSQGLPMRWLENDSEYRDICPLNAESIALESLPQKECFTLGPVEERLSLIEQIDGQGERVALRTLFAP